MCPIKHLRTGTSIIYMIGSCSARSFIRARGHLKRHAAVYGVGTNGRNTPNHHSFSVQLLADLIATSTYSGILQRLHCIKRDGKV